MTLLMFQYVYICMQELISKIYSSAIIIYYKIIHILTNLSISIINIIIINLQFYFLNRRIYHETTKLFIISFNN